MQRLSLALVVLASLSGCATQVDGSAPGVAGDDLNDSAGSTYSVVDMDLGEGLRDIAVQAVPNGVSDPSPEQIAAASFVGRVHVLAGQTVVALVRKESELVDPYVILRNGDGSLSESGDSQSVLTIAGETDAIATVTAVRDEDLFVFATGGERMQTSGLLAVDVFELDQAPGINLGASNVYTRAETGALRQRQSEVAGAIASGYASEGADGYLLAEIANVPLSERTYVSGLVGDVNDLRAQLFADLAAETGGDAARVASACAALWQVAPAL